MINEKKLIGQADQKQIDEWKKKHKHGIYGVVSGGHIGYFRNPTRRDMNIATSQLDMDNLMDTSQIIMEETMIGGSKVLLEDDEIYLGAAKQVQKKMEGAKSKLVNL